MNVKKATKGGDFFILALNGFKGDHQPTLRNEEMTEPPLIFR